jgi:hypothetical protein
MIGSLKWIKLDLNLGAGKEMRLIWKEFFKIGLLSGNDIMRARIPYCILSLIYYISLGQSIVFEKDKEIF